jgi:hypothetical protein
MIEREAAIKIYNETLGAKGAKGRLVRVSEHGYYEVLIESAGRFYTALLPVASTVILAGEPEEAVSTIEVER